MTKYSFFFSKRRAAFSFLMSLIGALLLFAACKSPFLDEFDKRIAESPAERLPVGEATQPFLEALECDGGLVLDSALPYPNLTAVSQGDYPDAIRVEWEGVAAKGKSVTYALYRKPTGSDAPLQRLMLGQSECSFNDSISAGDLEEGVWYDYWVRAVYTDSKTKTVRGSRLSYAKSGMLFSNITYLTVSLRDYTDRMVVQWKPAPGATAYHLYRKKAAEGNYELAATLNGSATSYTDFLDSIAPSDAHITFGVEYLYKVMPVKGSTEIAVTEKTLEVPGAILAPGAPPPQELLSVSKSDYGTGILLRWVKQEGVSVCVYRSKRAEGPFKRVQNDLTGDSWLDGTIPPAEADQTFYYRISGKSSGEEGALSPFDANRHQGRVFVIPKKTLSVVKLKVPSQIQVTLLPQLFAVGDRLYVQYRQGSTDSWTEMKSDGFTSDDLTFVLNADNLPGFDPNRHYFYRARLIRSDQCQSGIFDEIDSYGKSALIEAEIQKGPPLPPKLTLSQGTLPGKVKIEVSWPDSPETAEQVTLSLTRRYSFGKEENPDYARPIPVKTKRLVNSAAPTGNAYSFEDSLTPDINPNNDIILPMNAKIPAGSGWTYWTWDREAWKYIKRKQPFDMRAAVGCTYTVTVGWKEASDGWTETVSREGYGFPALTDDEFAWLGLWLRDCAMNRLWHLVYPPFHGTISTATSILLTPQAKPGEYRGMVWYKAVQSGLGGDGEGGIANYSDWGSHWSLSIGTWADVDPATGLLKNADLDQVRAVKNGDQIDLNGKQNAIPDRFKFKLSVQLNKTAHIHLPLVVFTPLYQGTLNADFEIFQGSYYDKVRSGSLQVTQYVNGQPKPVKIYSNVERDNSVVGVCFPPVCYEERIGYPGEGAGPSFELSTINFKYPDIHLWHPKQGRWNQAQDKVDLHYWDQYYGFTFESN